jgi:peptidoglycan/xylan/chitin deacetylase (PgdA/CDA1 family)
MGTVVGGLNLVLRPLQKTRLKYQPHAGILLFHRVADLPSDPQLLCVTPAQFEEQIKYISHNYNPVSLRELLDIKQKNKIPKGTIAITFDDGYADNLRNAQPILQKYDVPATVFVTTGYLDTNLEFWWDDLERIILLPQKLPDKLTLTIDGRTLTWEGLGSPRLEKFQNSHNGEISPESNRYESWNVTQGTYPEPKHKLYMDLYHLLFPLVVQDRRSALDMLASWSGALATGRPDYMALSRDEVCSLDQDGLFEIGSHTINHPVMKYQSRDVQKKEIFESKQVLEQILHHEVTSFSYPFGTKADFSRETENLVKHAGYRNACVNFPGPVTRRTDRYRLPRYIVQNMAKEKFVETLSDWLNG